MAAVPGKQVRAAKTFLGKHAKARSKDISPRKFAAASAELNTTFAGTLRLLRYYYASGDERAEMRRTELVRRPKP